MEKEAKTILHIWGSDIFGVVGGLQKHLYFILQTSRDLFSDSRVKAFLKLDNRNVLFALRVFFASLIYRPKLIIVGHVNFSPIAYIIKRLTKIPFWVVTYGIEAWGIRKNLLKKSLLASDRILAMSNFTKNRIASEQNMPLDKISVLPGTFDAQLFRIKPKSAYLLSKYRLNQKQPVILTVCRLDKAEKYKGYDKIIAAMPSMIKYFPDIRYILVGYGSDTEKIKELVKKFKLDKYVILPGKITGEELCDYYNLCDCFAMPSAGEGFGIVFLEALACGKPVLAGNQDGSVEALQNGELGVLVNPDNINEITDSLIQILKKEHPNKTIYNPQLLREKAIAYFGFNQFKMTLKKYLKEQNICVE